MKQLLLLLSFFILTSSAFAQKMAHDRYTVSGGLVGGINYGKFRIDGDNAGDLEYKNAVGWAAGVYLNLPLGHVVSLEPQVLYSLHGYQALDGPSLITSGNLNYISIPVLFKFHFNKGFALTLGPQVDILGGVDDVPASVTKDDFTSTSFSASGGLEFVPRAPVVIFARYVYGFADMDNRAEADPEINYYNSYLQAGLKLKLFGKMIPADTDADGIPDVDDKCPTAAGLAILAGCPDRDGDGITDGSDACPDKAGLARYEGCPIPDTDNDGVNDETDKCISVAGVLKYNGCPIPDADVDGINDEEDDCPYQVGVAKYKGCPIPDTDNDGINDELDKCPTVAGVALHNGCPVPDRDKDGLNDADDRCPDIPGLKENNGCPKIESAKFNTQRIQFVTGSATLTADAKANIREGAKLLNSADFKMLKVEIRGHTDNVGSEDSNLILSDKRAKAVLAELAKNGVAPERMTAVGFGESMPIADNTTKEGRAQNRRVAFDVRQ